MASLGSSEALDQLRVLPKGKRARRMSLKCWMPKGRPMMVTEKIMPQTRCVRAIGIPPTNHHITFIMPARQPDGQPELTMFVPKGHIATAASFMVCSPNGMPMMVIIISILEMAYSIAIISPPNTTHSMLRNTFISRQICVIQ